MTDKKILIIIEAAVAIGTCAFYAYNKWKDDEPIEVEASTTDHAEGDGEEVGDTPQDISFI
jgi:hypothetical protein